MKIGILTFHSQLNYGGVLQCWALQTALEKLGHEVVVIDRWEHDGKCRMGVATLDVKGVIKAFVKTLLGLGELDYLIRAGRTLKFIENRLNLTPYHFFSWKDAPKNLGVDMIVVGSDQVWHYGGSGNHRVYLLDGAPPTPAISYAASFGMRELPTWSMTDYMEGLAKFVAISCREREGADICCELGFPSAHVVDPVLLAWGDQAETHKKEAKEPVLVSYFLSEKVDAYIDMLYAFAKNMDCKVKIFVGGVWSWAFNSNRDCMKAGAKKVKARLSSHMEIMSSAGPEEFLDAFRKARWVVSDSFHALMFSIIYGCNVRIVKPSTEGRMAMFARIEEFAAHTKGEVITDSIQDALDSFEKGETVEYDYSWISCRRHESYEWLKRGIAKCFILESNPH